MSYTVSYAERAIAGLRPLDSQLQEEVLDEVEALALNPQLLKVRPAAPHAYFDFVRDWGGTRHYVFLTISRDDHAEHRKCSRSGMSRDHFSKGVRGLSDDWRYVHAGAERREVGRFRR